MTTINVVARLQAARTGRRTVFNGHLEAGGFYARLCRAAGKPTVVHVPTPRGVGTVTRVHASTALDFLST